MLALALLNLNFDENNAADHISAALLILSLFVLIILNKLFPITKFTDRFKNFSYFSLAKADGFTVIWPDGQDICPDELYYNSVPI